MKREEYEKEIVEIGEIDWSSREGEYWKLMFRILLDIKDEIEIR